MGFWGFGVLGFGVLGFWGFGVLGFWGFGVLGFWGFGETERAPNSGHLANYRVSCVEYKHKFYCFNNA